MEGKGWVRGGGRELGKLPRGVVTYLNAFDN